MKKYKEHLLNQEFTLSRRSVGDKISTFSTKRLLGTKAKQYSCYELGLRGGITVTAYSNRKDGTSLTINNANLPRFVKLPRVKRPSKVIVMYVKRLY